MSSEEIFVWVKGYEGIYKISNTGKVLSFKKKDPVQLKPSAAIGYETVILYKNVPYGSGWIQKNWLVHRLVAMHFVPGYKEGLHVNHKDFNRFNNHHTNLEWVTNPGNVEHARINGVYKRSHEKLKKPVKATHPASGEVLNFPSTRDAEKYGFRSGCISKSAKHGVKHKGYYWSYV